MSVSFDEYMEGAVQRLIFDPVRTAWIEPAPRPASPEECTPSVLRARLSKGDFVRLAVEVSLYCVRMYALVEATSDAPALAFNAEGGAL